MQIGLRVHSEAALLWQQTHGQVVVDDQRYLKSVDATRQHIRREQHLAHAAPEVIAAYKQYRVSERRLCLLGRVFACVVVYDPHYVGILRE